MTAPTLRRLLHEQDLGIRFVTGVSGAHREVNLASTTELTHPGQYIVSGELVMTNGLWLPLRTPQEWVGEVVLASAVGVAWGLDGESNEIPTEVVLACDAAGLPLLSVDADVSFATIAERVRSLTWGTASHALRDQVVRGRQFAAVAPTAEKVLEELRRQTGLLAALIDPDGEIVATTSSRSFHDQMPALLQISFPNALPTPLDRTVVFPVLPTHRDRCAYLVVDSDIRSLSHEMLLTIDRACLAAAVCDMRAAVMADHAAADTAMLVDLIEHGSLTGDECSKRLGRLGLEPAAGVCVACVSGSPPDVRALRAQLSQPSIWHPAGPFDIVVLDRRGSIELAGLLEQKQADAAVAVGLGSVVACEPVLLRRSMAEARLSLQNRQAAARRPSPDSAHEALHPLLLSMVDPGVTDAFAESVLGALQRWDRENGTDLLATLTHYFRLDCRLVEAARDLFIHPNTLRNRLARIEELTGRNLASTRDRVDVALALELWRTPPST
jgi:hypothetical protein